MIITGYSRTFGWSPTDVSGLIAWYDFSDTSTLWQNTAKTTPVASNGDKIRVAEDKSGNSRDVVSDSDLRRPTYTTSAINGVAAADFGTGIDMYSSTFTAISQPYTGFAVAKLDTSGGTQPLTDGGSGTNRYHLVYRSGAGNWSTFSGVELQDGAVDLVAHYFSTVTNGTSSELWIDGTSVKTGNAGTLTIARIILGSNVPAGGSSYWDGPVGEVFIYDSELSTTDRQTAESYLASKWGL